MAQRRLAPGEFGEIWVEALGPGQYRARVRGRGRDGRIRDTRRFLHQAAERGWCGHSPCPVHVVHDAGDGPGCVTGEDTDSTGPSGTPNRRLRWNRERFLARTRAY